MGRRSTKENKSIWQLTREEYGRWDLLIGMEETNIRHMLKICGGDPDHRIRLLLDFTDSPRDIADPWFSGDFETTWREISEGCAALFAALTEGH